MNMIEMNTIKTAAAIFIIIISLVLIIECIIEVVKYKHLKDRHKK